MVANKLLPKKRTVRTDDLIKSIKNLFLEDRKLLLRKAANLLPASISTIRIVAHKDLKFSPFKFIKTFKLYPKDYEKRFEDLMNTFKNPSDWTSMNHI